MAKFKWLKYYFLVETKHRPLIMRSLFATRRQSTIDPSNNSTSPVNEVDTAADLPLPPARPDEQNNTKKSGIELTNMEEFASKLEATCRLVLIMRFFYLLYSP